VEIAEHDRYVRLHTEPEHGSVCARTPELHKPTGSVVRSCEQWTAGPACSSRETRRTEVVRRTAAVALRFARVGVPPGAATALADDGPAATTVARRA
jgi:hypothetical protein